MVERGFVTNSWNGRIAHYDVSGVLVRSFGSKGLEWPTGLALGQMNGVLQVVNTASNRISSLTLSGKSP